MEKVPQLREVKEIITAARMERKKRVEERQDNWEMET